MLFFLLTSLMVILMAVLGSTHKLNSDGIGNRTSDPPSPSIFWIVIDKILCCLSSHTEGTPNNSPARNICQPDSLSDEGRLIT